MNLIETKGLTKSFKGTVAVNNFNLSLKDGVCTALLGPNGAGKSTLLNMISGLMKPTEGAIYFNKKYAGDIRKYIGYLPQYPKFYNWMSGEEYMIFSGQLGGLTKNQSHEKSADLLELVGLTEDRKKKISAFSGGMKQRLGIAQALVHDPKLLILDEPVSSLDPIGRREVLNLMDLLKEKTSILFSTHVLHDAEQICEEVYIMNKGKKVIHGSFTELQRTYQKPTIYIETEQALDEWSNALKDVSWLRHLEVKENHATLTVDDIQKARQDLLTNEGLHHLGLIKFEISKTSLEDLFMEVMKS